VATDSNKTCCILGGCGFLGSVSAVRLALSGWRVRVLDKDGVDDARLAPVRSAIELIRGDFMNAGDLRAGLQGVSLVLNFVGATIPQSSMADIDYDIHANVIPVVQLLEIMREMKIPRVIYSSSGGTVYGQASEQRPIPETHPTEPICAYGISKLMAEKYIRLFAANYGLLPIILRISNPYGENQNPLRPQGAVSVFLHKVLRDEEIVVWGDGAVVRDYLHQSEVADAVLAVANKPLLEGVFNVGSETGTSLRGVLDAVGSVLGKRPSVRFTPARSFDVPYNVLDCARLREATGWKPRLSLHEGIRMLREHLR
jgi:UDP-glucose 4-epimerase